MDVKILGRVRKLLETLEPEALGRDTTQLELTPSGDQLVAWGTPPNQENVKGGRSFWISNTTPGSAQASYPTIGILLAIYNNEPDGGRTYVIDAVGAINSNANPVANQAMLLVNVGQVRETPPNAFTTFVPKKLNGYGAVSFGAVQPDTKALVIVSGAGIPANTGQVSMWQPVGQSGIKFGAANTPGYGMYYEANGRWMIPPGRYFCIHVLGQGGGAETFTGYIAWHERQLTLG